MTPIAPTTPATLATLVIGTHPAAREQAIAAAINPDLRTAVILEGLASGAHAFDAPAAGDVVQLHRIAPGCMCCIGNLTLRVTLNRILRHPPQRLFIGLATSTHLPKIRNFLTSAPYDALLSLTDELVAAPSTGHDS